MYKHTNPVNYKDGSDDKEVKRKSEGARMSQGDHQKLDYFNTYTSYISIMGENCLMVCKKFKLKISGQYSRRGILQIINRIDSIFN